MSLQKVFSANASNKSDNLQQRQREAIVDLLHYCMFADNFVGLAEDRFINSVGATLNWDKNISFEVYEGSSIGNARKAKENAEYRARFLDGIVQRLATKEARTLALQLSKDLYNTDGMSELESQQLAVIKKLLA